MNAIAIFMGGHVRTGLEDNPPTTPSGPGPPPNPGLVARSAEIAVTAGRRLATPAEVRERLGLIAA